MEIGGRHLLGEHVLRGLIVGPRLYVRRVEVRRPDGEYPLQLVMLHVVLGIADEFHELPRHLLVRAVLVDQVRPGEQRAGTGARLLARQRVDLEVHIGCVLLQPAEEPRFPKDDSGAFLPEGIFRIAECEARHMVLVDEIAEERERGHHLRAVGVAGGLVQVRTQHPRAPRVREGKELVRDPHRSTLAANGEPNLRRLAALGVGNGQLLHVRQPLVEGLGRIVRIQAGLLEHVDVDVHLLEVAVLDGDPVADTLPLADLDHVLRQVVVVRLCQIGGHLVAEIVLAAPLVRHPHEDVGRAALGHERREVLGVVSLIRDGDHLDLVAGLLRKLFPFLRVPLVEVGVLIPMGPEDQLLLLRVAGVRDRNGNQHHRENQRQPPSTSFHEFPLRYL